MDARRLAEQPDRVLDDATEGKGVVLQRGHTRRDLRGEALLATFFFQLRAALCKCKRAEGSRGRLQLVCRRTHFAKRTRSDPLDDRADEAQVRAEIAIEYLAGEVGIVQPRDFAEVLEDVLGAWEGERDWRGVRLARCS